MKTFLDRAVMQHHPLRVLETFLEQEWANEQAQKYEAMRFVGYVLDIGYETITIITSDPFKIAVGGIPRNSLLIMVPASFERLPLHFTLLRVLELAPTPLTKEVQQTYFELQKKSMPELDVFTQSELQWGALNTGVLGMFYANPERMNAVEFSGDLNNFVSAHKYRLYAPDDALLDLIVNALVPEENRFVIGDLRLTECRLPLPNSPQPQVKAFVSTTDYMGTRTAMFGKTRLGKSNVVKLIAQSLLETTVQTRNVGQLIFDINGEYANDNPQDGSRSLRSGYAERCEVYAFIQRPNTPSNPLKLNFYEHPESALPILGSLLKEDNRVSTYIQAFTSVELPSLEELASLPAHGGDLVRPLRRVQIYWAIMKKAGYQADEAKLLAAAPTGSPASRFQPGFLPGTSNSSLPGKRQELTTPPPAPDSLDTLVRELEVVNKFRRENQDSDLLKSRSSGKPLFEADDKALLEFLDPPPGRSGPTLLQSYRKYHHPHAGDAHHRNPEFVGCGKNGDSGPGKRRPCRHDLLFRRVVTGGLQPPGAQVHERCAWPPLHSALL